ncbi:hypothetical protein DPMN_079426 [Dreissena polymorpha]|uniref:Uncharacterized protein n=1 Tax=Dreissena polymorpha TaxID=45954 RepID=A0A9D4BIC9_DREPO|nr:hypothetical protein DPMN_079426 [Dreissena polymorpha]
MNYTRVFVVTLVVIATCSQVFAPHPQRNNNGANILDIVKEKCKQLCTHAGTCPPECAEEFLDPWSR